MTVGGGEKGRKNGKKEEGEGDEETRIRLRMCPLFSLRKSISQLDGSWGRSTERNDIHIPRETQDALRCSRDHLILINRRRGISWYLSKLSTPPGVLRRIPARIARSN